MATAGEYDQTFACSESQHQHTQDLGFVAITCLARTFEIAHNVTLFLDQGVLLPFSLRSLIPQSAMNAIFIRRLPRHFTRDKEQVIKYSMGLVTFEHSGTGGLELVKGGVGFKRNRNSSLDTTEIRAIWVHIHHDLFTIPITLLDQLNGSDQTT